MLKRLYIFFGNSAVKHLGKRMSPLKKKIIRSNISMIFEIYVGKMITIALLSFILFFSLMTGYFIWAGGFFWYSIIGGLIAGTASAAGVLALFYLYPFHLISSRKTSIDTNHPFAINHMAAIAASGVPPFIIFKLLAAVPEYGEVAKESKRILRNVDTFGMDMISAIRNVAERTPSPEFKQFLFGLISTIDTGGDMQTYLENSAKDALFDYRLKRERFMQTLATYADFYTAVLIAAPLFFVSVLSVMSIIGGQIFGLSIPDLMRIGIFVLIPVLNSAFILFIHYTQPSV